ncbi:RHS repeat-associated core domain-containing protein, partial [Paenibacillus alba]
MNLYTYVQNNPLTHTDPTGHCNTGDEICDATSPTPNLYYKDSDNIFRTTSDGEVAWDYYLDWYENDLTGFTNEMCTCENGTDATEAVASVIPMKYLANHLELL